MQQLIHRHDTGVERIVLATVLLNPEVLDTPDGLLPDTAFYSEAVRNLYRAATRVYRATGCCDVKLVGEDARRHGMRDAPLQLASVLADSDVMDSPTFCTAYFPATSANSAATTPPANAAAPPTYQAALAKGQDETERASSSTPPLTPSTNSTQSKPRTTRSSTPRRGARKKPRQPWTPSQAA